MIKTIIWDYDGTLADSNKKNYRVTLDLFRNEAPQVFDLDPPNLRSQEAFNEALTRYEDWKELYNECYKLNDDDVERLGKLWTKYQMNSNVDTEIFSGLDSIIESYSDIPHAVISQNGTNNIKNVLSSYGLLKYFKVFIGIDEIPFEYQKPYHLSMIKCLEQLNINANEGKIIYIGDHEVDTQFIRNTQKYYSENNIKNDLVAVAVSYGGSKPHTWKTVPDYIAENTDQLKCILNKLNEE